MGIWASASSRLLSRLVDHGTAQLVERLGGRRRARVIVVLACVLGLSGADTSTIGASATQLRADLGVTNTDIGLLVMVTSAVGAVTTLPFGVLADHVNRTRALGLVVGLWAVAMGWSAAASNYEQLLLARLFLGVVVAAAGPAIASLLGDYFGADERGRVYGYVLAGELAGGGVGLAVSGSIAAFSWRAAFVALAPPALVLAWAVLRLPEPVRGGPPSLPPEPTSQEQADRCVSHKRQTAGGPGGGGKTRASAAGLHVRPGRRPSRGQEWPVRGTAAFRAVLRVPTNLSVIAASVCGYYFLAGLQTFGLEFAKKQYRIGQLSATVMLLVVGVGALLGVLLGGFASDRLVRSRHLNGRVFLSAITAVATAVLLAPALITRAALFALPFLVGAAFMHGAHNPPLEAIRLDIMPAPLWGRAESIRTCLRAIAQGAAPVLFGFCADHLSGGGWQGLRTTFAIMLAPLVAGGWLLFRCRRTYPGDAAAAGTNLQ
jgi:predicted MFS family arabinose efflux permease